MVRSPVTSSSSPWRRRILVDLNVIVGNLSTAKKSPLRRWVSRCSSRVEMEAIVDLDLDARLRDIGVVELHGGR